MSGIINSAGSRSGVIGQTEEKVGMVHLATLTADDYGSLAFEGYFTSDYTHYSFYFSLYASTNNCDTGIYMRQSNADISTGNLYYSNCWGGINTAGTVTETAVGNWAANNGRISSGDNTNNVLFPTTGVLILANPLSTVAYKTWSGHCIGYNSAPTPSAIRNWQFAGMFRSTAVLSGMSFMYESSNIDATVSMLGIKNS